MAIAIVVDFVFVVLQRDLKKLIQSLSSTSTQTKNRLAKIIE